MNIIGDSLSGKSPFVPIKSIHLKKLTELEREKWYDFIIDNSIKLFRDDSGNYMANVRMYPTGVERMEEDTATPKNSNIEKPESNEMINQNFENLKSIIRNSSRLSEGKSTVPLMRRKSRTGKEMQEMVHAINSSKSLYNLSCYSKFCSLIKFRSGFKPKRKPLSWLMRMIEEIYDSRYEHDIAELDANRAVGKEDRLSNILPVFVIDFFVKKYGLRSLVDQICWDLLYNLHALRKNHLEVEVFGRFLEEYYDGDDMLFFLYVRSVVQNELGLSFRSSWSDLHREREVIWLSFRACVSLSKAIFGREAAPVFQSFLEVIEAHLVAGRKTCDNDTRRIEVMQFMHLALAEYHKTRPEKNHIDEEIDEETEEDREEPVEGMDNNQELVLAERSSNPEINVIDHNEDIINESALKGREEEAYDDNTSTRTASRMSDGALTFNNNNNNNSSSSTSGGANDTSFVYPSNDVEVVGRQKLLEALGFGIHHFNTEFIGVMLKPYEYLPEDMLEEIAESIANELEDKVQLLLEKVFTNGDTENDDNNNVLDGNQRVLLREKFSILLEAAIKETLMGNELNSTSMQAGIDDFCRELLRTPQVRTEVENLVALMISYALSVLDKDEI